MEGGDTSSGTGGGSGGGGAGAGGPPGGGGGGVSVAGAGELSLERKCWLLSICPLRASPLGLCLEARVPLKAIPSRSVSERWRVPVHEVRLVLGGGVVQELVPGDDAVQLSAHV